jgi:hypothetical protein
LHYGLTVSGVQLWGFSPRCFIQAPFVSILQALPLAQHFWWSRGDSNS